MVAKDKELKIDFDGSLEAPQIGDFLDLESLIPETLKIKDCVGQKFLVLGFQMREGDMGDYALIAVFDPISNEELVMTTSTYPVLIALKAAQALGVEKYWVQIEAHATKSFKFINPID